MIVYIIPAMAMVYVGIETFVRNPRRMEHRLVTLDLFVIGGMFLEEFVRQLVPVSESPWLVTFIFGNLGAMSASLGMHFYVYLIGWNQRILRRVYLPICYFPIFPLILTLLLRRNLYTSSDFSRVGIWIQPVYNQQYFIAIWCGIGVIAMLSYCVWLASLRATSNHMKYRYRTVFTGTLILLVWFVLSGGLVRQLPVFIHMPPYMYIYGLIFWLFVLRWTMLRYNLLPPYERKYRTIFNLVPAAILMIDSSGRVVEANPKAVRTFGSVHLHISDFVVLDSPQDQRAWMTAHFRTGAREENIEMDFRRADGSIMSGEVQMEMVEVDGNGLLAMIVWDITERIQAERQVRRLAYYDTLTGLPNRVHFYSLMKDTLTRASQSGESFGLLLMDIDGFKLINDRYGHLIGDAVIQWVGTILNSVSNVDGVAARLGGDEFVMIVSKLPHESTLKDLASWIHGRTSVPLRIDEHEISVSLSIGWSTYPVDGHTEHDLIKRADMDMYQVKNGKDARRWVRMDGISADGQTLNLL